MMDLNNTRDVNRERILSQLYYNQSTPHSVDSATYPTSISLAGTNFQPIETANIGALLMDTLFKLVASLTAGSAYHGGGIGGTGHIADDGAPLYDRADFIAINAYQGGGIGGSGNAPDEAEFLRLHVSQLDTLVNDVLASGGIGGSGHTDDGAEFSQEVTGKHGGELVDTGGGIGGSGHSPDSLPSYQLADADAVLGNAISNSSLATFANSSTGTNLNSANVIISVTGTQDAGVIDLILGGVDVQQDVAVNSGFSDNQPDIVTDGQPQVTTIGVSENALTLGSLIFEEVQLLSGGLDAVVVMESENSQTLTLQAFMYESLNELNQGSSQAVIC